MDFSTLLSIDRNDFISMLQKCFPEEYQKFCQIKDKVQFQEDFGQVGTSCFVCDSSKHLMNKCYLIHYEPYSLKIVKDYLREINQTVQVERVALADLYKQHKDEKEKKKR